jgi:hypothetical protein
LAFDAAPAAGAAAARDARALLDDVLACEAALQEAAASMDDEALRAATAAAHRLGYGNPRAEPAVAGVAVLRDAEALLHRVAAAQDAFRAALACKAEPQLRAALAEAAAFGYDRAAAGRAACAAAALLLQRAVAATAALRDASAKLHAGELAAAVADAASFGFGAAGAAGEAAVAAAKALLGRVEACDAALAAATASLDTSQLAAALAAAHALGYGQPARGASSAGEEVCGVDEVARAQSLLQRVAAVEAGLRDGLATSDAESLEGHLAEADALGYGVAPCAGVEV